MIFSVEKMLRSLPAALLALGLASEAPAAHAVGPDATDAVAIMKAVEGRAEGDRMSARLTMTVKDAAGREKARVVRARAMDVPGGRRMLMLFEAPAEDRGTGLLTIDHDDGKKADDQWLYLPSLAKSTRISGAGRSGTFLGSDLTYADMTGKDVNDYVYTISQQSVKVDGEDCWLIDSKPRSSKVRDETGYERSQLWVSKAKLMPVQMKAWLASGRKVKLLRFVDIVKQDGVWFAKKIMVRTLDAAGQPESTTVLLWSELRFGDAGVTEGDFTERRLEKGL
jgi:outer membrane lipoprotein-sorting protein